jgi:hypothetical protein
MPIYVAGVSYGVMALFTIETDFSYEEMNLAIDGAYSGVVDVRLSSGFTAREMLQQSNVRVVVYGGSTLGLDAIEEGFEGFMEVVQASTEFNNTARRAARVQVPPLLDNTPALVTHLPVRWCGLQPASVRPTINNFCEMADDRSEHCGHGPVPGEGLGLGLNSDSDPESMPRETSVYYWAAGEHNMDGGDT